MPHTAGVSMPETSVPSSGRNKPPTRILGGSLLIACSNRSDGGVRREGREREKNKNAKWMKKKKRMRNAIPESLWQRRPKGSEPLETRITFFFVLYFWLMRSVFRRCVSGNISLDVSAPRQWLPIRAHKSFHRCVLCSNFRWPFSTSLFFFCVLAFTVFILWGRYLDREVRKTILVRHIHVCISITWSIVTDVLVTFRYFTFPK